MEWRLQQDEGFARLFKQEVEERHRKQVYTELKARLSSQPDLESKANHPLNTTRPPQFPGRHVWQFEASHGYRIFFEMILKQTEEGLQGIVVPFFISKKRKGDTTESMYKRVMETCDDN